MNNNIITEDNCVDQYNVDSSIAKTILKRTAEKERQHVCEVLIDFLYEKYKTFIESEVDRMPTCGVDIFDDFLQEVDIEVDYETFKC